jgi:hypothetical protein
VSPCYATLNLHLIVLVMCILSFRLEEKLSNVESENKVLRQQAVSMAPSKILSGRSKSNLQVNQFVQLCFTLWPILENALIIYNDCLFHRGILKVAMYQSAIRK